MSTHRYPWRELAGDYARGGIGVMLTGLPLATVPTGPAGRWIFGSLFTLFLLFLARTGLRQRTRIEIDADGISQSRARLCKLLWRNVDRVGLRYFSTRFDRSGGWMQLTLKGRAPRRTVIRIDSTIDNFPEIARAAAAAARENRLQLSTASLANFAALGLTPAGSSKGWEGLATKDGNAG